jgi:hypothetical protein
MKNYLESSINMNVGKIMANLSYGWNDLCTETTIKTLIEGSAVYLGRNKSKDRPVCVELRDMNDKFHFGMYVQYIKQDEDGADEGSWALSMTFDEKDIDHDNWTIVKYPDDQVLAGIIYDVGYTRYGAYYKYSPKETNNTVCDGSPQELFCICVDGIVEYMRANVAIDPELEMTNYFTASAKLEGDGSVYIGVEPSALMKQHIKDDAAIDQAKSAA